jgi:hypothetical protein
MSWFASKPTSRRRERVTISFKVVRRRAATGGHGFGFDEQIIRNLKRGLHNMGNDRGIGVVVQVLAESPKMGKGCKESGMSKRMARISLRFFSVCGLLGAPFAPK